MERDWSGNARRLSQADRSEIERLMRALSRSSRSARLLPSSHQRALKVRSITRRH
jgi:hypothetical protein